MDRSQRARLAAVFWIAVVLLVVVDQVRGFARHDRFDEPAPWALGSGTNDAARGAHCTAVPLPARPQPRS